MSRTVRAAICLFACCYFLNVKNFDKAEDTTFKCETKQTNMSANMEKKNRNSENRNSI